MESTTMILKNFSYGDLNDEIKREMRSTARSAVQLGYMLKRMCNEHLWENVYDDFDTYLAKELGIDYTAARRLMQMNDKYSIGGNSAEMSEVFEDYSKSLLIEMLAMTPEQEAQVTPVMTVKQVRQIKQDPVSSDPEEDNVSGQMQLEKDFPEYCPEKVATSRTDDEEYKSTLIKKYFDSSAEHLEKLMHICRENNNTSEAAKAFQEYESPYGAHGGCIGNDLFYEFYSFAKGIDLKYHAREVHFTYIEFIKRTLELYDPVNNKKSPYGYEKSEYPENSPITCEGCGNKHSCFCCAEFCNIRQENRYCVEAPLGAPFECVVMHTLEGLSKECRAACQLNECQFMHHEFAHQCQGDKSYMPCCKECKTPCAYQCQRSRDKRKEKLIVVDADFREVEKQQKPELPCDDCGYDDKGCCNYPDTPDDYCVLGDKRIEPQAKELFVRDHPESREQLPKFRNNEERKKWLCAYKAWGLWYRDENIDVNYYKYDFKDGSRLIVAEYPQRESTWSNERDDEYYFHLLQKNKQKYGGKKTYDTQYCNSTDSETYLVEFIKNLQKGEK